MSRSQRSSPCGQHTDGEDEPCRCGAAGRCCLPAGVTHSKTDLETAGKIPEGIRHPDEGFISLFIFGVSLRTLPMCLGLPDVKERYVPHALILYNLAIAVRIAAEPVRETFPTGYASKIIPVFVGQAVSPVPCKSWSGQRA